MGFQVWVHKWALNLKWVVLRIGGADFLHCWVADFLYGKKVLSPLYIAFTAAYLEC